MGRMRQGWDLTKKSWAILKGNRQLMWFAVLGGLTALLATAALVGPGFLLLSDNQTPAGIALIAIGTYIATFIGIYFNVGLAAAADKIMRGESATIRDGLAVSRTRIGPIAGWALFAVTVNLILNALRNQEGIVGQILGSLIAVAWALATFLVIPVIALEGSGPVTALKRSAGLFRQKWGQQVTGIVAIGGLVALFTVLPAVALGALGIVALGGGGAAAGGGVALIVIAVVLLIAGAIVSAALRGIFGVVLFRFTSGGEVIGGFEAADLENAVRMKR